MGTVSKNRGMSCVGVRKTGTTLIRVSTVMGTLYKLSWQKSEVCVSLRVMFYLLMLLFDSGILIKKIFSVNNYLMQTIVASNLLIL